MGDEPKPKPEKRKVGRPRKLDDARLRHIVVRTIQDGGSRADAARMARIDRTSLTDYVRDHPEFAAELDYAETEGKIAHLRNVKAAGDHGEWRASMALLERKWWKEFAKRKPGEISPDRLVNIIVQLTNRLRDALPAKQRPLIDGIVRDVVTAIEAGNK